MVINKKILLVLGLGFLLTYTSWTQTQEGATLSTPALKQRTLEELMDIDITIVSKRPQRWFEASAAVYISYKKDINVILVF